MLTFQDVYDYCISSLRKDSHGVSNRENGGSIQVYAGMINVQCAVSIDTVELPVLKLEFNSDIRKFRVYVADDKKCILLYKQCSYPLDKFITSIINDMPNAYCIVDAVAVLLKA